MRNTASFRVLTGLVGLCVSPLSFGGTISASFIASAHLKILQIKELQIDEDISVKQVAPKDLPSTEESVDPKKDSKKDKKDKKAKAPKKPAIDAPKPEFIITGHFTNADWNLLVEMPGKTQPVDVDAKTGAFKINLPATDGIHEVRLMAVDPYGTIQRDTLQVKVSSKTPFWDIKIIPNLGISTISYQQTNVTSISEFALTPKIAVNQSFFNSKVNVEFSAYYNALTFFSSEAAKVSFLGMNLRGGYILSLPQDLTLALNVGAYYSTMFVSGGTFGYNFLLYPQLYPVLVKRIDQNRSAHLYVKFVSTSKSISFSFSERELAVGGGYTFMGPTKHLLTVGLDFSNLAFKLNSKNEIGVTLWNLSVGYHL